MRSFNGQAWLLVPLLTVGCSGDRSPGERARVEVDTVGGIERVTNLDSGEDPVGLPWVVDTTGVRIGVVEGEDEYVFGSIAGIAVDPDRRIYIADGQALEVRVFSPEGRFEFRFGRAGQGPGEFESIDAVRIGPRGRVLVRDPRLLRLSIFSPAGEFQGSFRLQRPFIQFADRGTLWVDGDGRIYDRVGLSLSPDVDSVGIVSYEKGEVLDTALIHVGATPRIMVRQGGVPRVSAPVPFSPELQLAVEPAGRIIAGQGAKYRIAVITTGGDTVRVVSREVTPTSLPDWARDTVEIWVQRLKEMAGGGEVDAFELPRHQAYFTDLLVDGLGHWWVGREVGPDAGPETSSREYDVFAPTGEFLGSVQVPLMLIYEIGEDFIAGRVTDAMGVPRAVVLGLARQ